MKTTESLKTLQQEQININSILFFFSSAKPLQGIMVPSCCTLQSFWDYTANFGVSFPAKRDFHCHQGYY